MDKWTVLDDKMMTRRFLTSHNPVLVSLEVQNLSTATRRGVWTIQQYCSLVRMIIEYLGRASRMIPVPAVQDELARNIAEEQGSRTNGVPHRELLARLFRDELDVEAFAPWSDSTLVFHLAILKEFNLQKNPEFIAGMIYALEASASPELLVVSRIINSFAGYEVINHRKVRAWKAGREIENLEDFIGSHVVDFEAGHKQGLCEALNSFVSADWPTFEKGFDFMLDQMAVWWEALSRWE